MNLGLDIDGTITDDPQFFSKICREVLRGGEVHIVSSRSQEALQETINELADLGITYTTVHLIARMSEAQIICPHAELDWYQRHQWLKVDYALANGLTHFVDDDPKVLSLFNRFAPAELDPLDRRPQHLSLHLLDLKAKDPSAWCLRGLYGCYVRGMSECDLR